MGEVKMNASSKPRVRKDSLPSVFFIILSISLLILPTTAAKLFPSFKSIKVPSSSAAVAAVPVAAAVAVNFPRGGAAKSAAKGALAATPPSPANILRSFVKTIEDARSHLAAAAAARGLSIFCMYPVDTIKTRMQMKQGDAFRVAGLYKGVTGSLVGQVPYG